MALTQIAFYILCIPLLGLAFIPVYASNGTVVLLAIGALAFFSFKNGISTARHFLASLPGGLIIVLLFLIFISLLWADKEGGELWAAIALSLLCLAGFFFMSAIASLGSQQINIAQKVFLIASTAMIGFFIFEYITDGTLARYLKGRTDLRINFIGRGLSILNCVVWPAVALILLHYGKLIWAALFIFFAGIAAYLYGIALPLYANEGMFLSFLIGLFTFVSCLYAKRLAITFVFGVFAILVLSAPKLTPLIVHTPEIKSQFGKVLGYREHRLKIWDFVSSKVEERPIIGHGFEAARRIGGERERYFKATKDTLGPSRFRHLLPLHPHNIPLQIWLELGLIGIIVYLGIIAGIGKIIWNWRGPPIWAAALAASTASYLTASSLSFGAWQNWWIAVAWLTAGLFVLVRNSCPQDDDTDSLLQSMSSNTA